MPEVLDDLFLRSRGQHGGYHLKLSRYNVPEKAFTLVGATEITFTDSYKLVIDNGTGATIYFKGSIHYAEVI